MSELLSLPTALTGGVKLTIDLAASRELGHELIVLRVPEAAPRKLDPRLAVLSGRELEIAGMIASGLSNKQIAARSSITLATVKTHVHHILEKTRLTNRAAIAAAITGDGGPGEGDAASRPTG
jgi:DNA-binding NarL/FixJ family response regulator